MAVVKMCDMDITIAAKCFEALNPGKVQIKSPTVGYKKFIETDVEPKDLIYPEGWYYAKGEFRNKHTTTGPYQYWNMKKSSGETWNVPYCTKEEL